MDSTPLPLQERLPQNNNPKRAIELLILSLLLLLLSHRLSLIGVHGAPWLLAALCESWFAFIWALTVNAKWNPAVYRTFPENISKSKRVKELPHLDVFVTTADASLEPSIITVDTVLSVLAVDYPPERLACYVSDDGCSGATYRALVEASGFARLWVPFCKRHGVRTRAPSVYFSEIGSDGGGSPEFLDEWRMMKCPKQRGNIECGYFVMKYMKDIIENPEIHILQKFEEIVSYKEDEITTLRNEWCNIIQKFI